MTLSPRQEQANIKKRLIVDVSLKEYESLSKEVLEYRMQNRRYIQLFSIIVLGAFAIAFEKDHMFLLYSVPFFCWALQVFYIADIIRVEAITARIRQIEREVNATIAPTIGIFFETSFAKMAERPYSIYAAIAAFAIVIISSEMAGLIAGKTLQEMTKPFLSIIRCPSTFSYIVTVVNTVIIIGLGICVRSSFKRLNGTV